MSALRCASLASRRAAAEMPEADLHRLDRRIDACVYRAFDLPSRLVRAAEQGFWGERFDQEIQALERAMSDPGDTVAGKEGIA